jgi:hypothetical protein
LLQRDPYEGCGEALGRRGPPGNLIDRLLVEKTLSDELAVLDHQESKEGLHLL